MMVFDARAELLEVLEELGIPPQDVLVDEATLYVEDRSAHHGPDMVRSQWETIINEFSATGSDLI